jgi:hypothetical protein
VAASQSLKAAMEAGEVMSSWWNTRADPEVAGGGGVHRRGGRGGEGRWGVNGVGLCHNRDLIQGPGAGAGGTRRVQTRVRGSGHKKERELED